MPNLHPNSTNYVHSFQPNTNDLSLAMDYDPSGRPVIRIDDTSVQHTSQDRLKISAHEITFFNTFQFDRELDIWDEFNTAGGSSTHDANSRQVVLAVDATVPGAIAIRQTKSVQQYIPGRTAQASMAVVLGDSADAGIRKRAGVFDERNGLFLEMVGMDPFFVVRSDATGAVVDTRIPRAEWNQDKLDGTNGIGTTIDFSKKQILVFEYEWYGAGIAEIKFVIDDHPISVHKEFHANRQSLPWIGTPFNPFRFEIENISATAGVYQLEQGSASFALEGSSTRLGITSSVASPISGTTLTAADEWYPVLSIRLPADRLSGVVLPTFFQIATIDNTNVFYRIVVNPVISLTGASAWNGVPSSAASLAEYQTYTSPASIPEIQHGHRLDTGFVITGGGGQSITLNKETRYQLGRTALGTSSDVFTVLCASNGTNKTAIASMTWIEMR
jgi:hypothetical protein